MFIRTVFFYLCLQIALTGCTTLNVSKVDPQDSLDNDKGYVVGWIKEEKDLNFIARLSNGFSEHTQFLIHELAEDLKKPVIWKLKPTNNLVVYQLKPGRYELKGMETKLLGFKPMTMPLDKTSKQFTVKPGTVVYLGEAHTLVYTNWGHHVKVKKYSINLEERKKEIIKRYPDLGELEFIAIGANESQFLSEKISNSII